ncbi:hypothetical protein ACP275_13G108300 [Erythranthe tilingii]
MTTVEKLLVQIFDRKNSFIEQVKQQTELYSQHHASKLLIDGITPPSWLWNPNTSPDSKELNKEELISKLLRPYPQPPVHCSVGHYPVYNNLAVTGYNEEFSDGVFMGSMAFDNVLNRKDDPAVPTLNREDHSPRFFTSVHELDTIFTSPENQADERILNIPTVPALNREDHSPHVFNSVPEVDTSLTSPEEQADERILNFPTVPALTREDHSPKELNSFPELEISVTSPEDQQDERILNIYNAPDQSVAGIQRSKSRQKALELRNSAKVLTKSSLRHENTSNVFSSQIKFSLSATNQSGKKDEPPKLAEPCVIGSQICEDKELDEADYLSKGNGMAYSGRTTRSRSLSKVPINVGGSSASGCSMSDSGKITMSRSREIIPVYVRGSSTLGFSSHDCNDNSPSHVSKERGTECVPVSDFEQFPKSAGSSIVCSQSCAGRKVDGADCLSEDKDPNVFSGRTTRSNSSGKYQTGRDSSKAESPSDDFEKIGLSMTTSGDDLPPENVNGSLVEVNPSSVLNESCDARESISEDGKSHRGRGTVSSRSSSQQNADAEETSDLEVASHSSMDNGGILAPSSGTSAEQVNDTNEGQGLVKSEVRNLKAFTSTSGKRRFDNSLESMSCSLFISAVSIDKGISGGVDKLLLGNQSPGVSDGSSKGEEAHWEYAETDFPEDPDNEPENFEPVISNTMLKVFEDNEEPRLDCEIPEVYQEVDSTLSKVVDIPDIQIPSVKLHMEHGLESFAEQHVEEEEMDYEGEDKGQLVSNAPESENSRPSNCHNSATQPRAESCGCSNENSVRQTNMGSWPQPKRRKIEHQQTHSFTTSPSFRVRKPRSNQRDPASAYLENIEINTENALMDTFHVYKNVNTEIHQEMNSNLREGIESAILSQNGEVEFCNKEKNGFENPSSVIGEEQLETVLISSVIKESRNSQGHPSGSRSDTRGLGDGQRSPQFNVEKNSENLNSENLTLTNTMLEGLQSPQCSGALLTEYSLLSPTTEVMELIDVDQSMPVLEGFVVDEQSDNDQLDYAADGIDFDKLHLPRTTIERASILAEICRSASMDKPLSHFSSTYEFQGTENLFQSVPNGHLEHLDLGGTFSMNSDVGKQLQSSSSSGDDYRDAFEGMPYSDSVAYSAARYCWNPRNQYTSPVGKLWERLSSHTGSSEKRLSSNPELTCFPIEEDPCVSEENGTVEDNADGVQEEIDSSLANHRDNRQPLNDLTNLGLNPPTSVSAPDETFGTDSVDFVSARSSVSGTQDKVLWSPKNQYRNVRQIKEKQTSFIGATGGKKKHTSSICTKGIRKAKESINNSISRPLLSNKTSFQKQDQNLSLRPSRRNNIVSNVSSFIPLIQQKQEAPICAGKRDVKVKALEAAEAAKRLEEKRDNERKMRKEALKVERAKMEEENLRVMELDKKKKDADRKKKEADIKSKKRLREEEERKEKEKKRMRVEARQRQREQPEKMRGEKADKENQRTKDEQAKSKKEFHNESTKQQNKETTRGDNNIALKKTETKLAPTEVVMNYEECGTSGQSCEAGEAMHTLDKSPKNEDLIVRNSHGNSYEISPYQCSDDEDEEDELPTKKSIPSWASKSSVAVLLPLQQEMDPDVIFPLGSFCSMDEVLLPRKLQQKQMAA